MIDYRVMGTGTAPKLITAASPYQAAVIYAEDVIGYYDMAGYTDTDSQGNPSFLTVFYIFTQAPIRRDVLPEDALREWLLERITVTPVKRGQAGK